ncbi:MAG: restriction endonuclease [Mycobacterium sp.]|nr:restriction endonuclease [Mycobacterium sp.]
MRQHIADQSVDLVYLDPPFNSNRNYSVIFGRNRDPDESAAQIEAFEDTWRWSLDTDILISELSGTAPQRVADAISAYYTLLGESEALAYLVNMTPRLLQLHRVLKPTGSLFLHCDPTMSHYLKVLLDAIFDVGNFRNEIVWKRTSAHSDTKQGRQGFGGIHDVILFYSKGKDLTWNAYHTPYSPEYFAGDYRHTAPDGRLYKEGDVTAAKPGGDTEYLWPVKRQEGGKWEADLTDEYLTPEAGWQYLDVKPYNGRYWAYSKQNMREFAAQGKLAHRSTGAPRLMLFADEMPGIGPQDIWTDINPIGAKAAERLGYPTQKPLALMERIISVASNEGDVVLDPFCGCGTTVDAAQRLGRRWIGIDITYLAIDVITKRLQHTYGNEVFDTVLVDGIPKDLTASRALFAQSPLDFERWAVSMVNAEPNEKQVADKGIDGVARFPLLKGKIGKLLVSVKGGKTINPSMVRDLGGTVEAQSAQMGVLITLSAATKGITDAINRGGVFTHPANGQKYPRLQHITVADLLAGKRPQVPPTFLPYIAAQAHTVTLEQSGLFSVV